jgi:hypothetical protein
MPGLSNAIEIVLRPAIGSIAYGTCGRIPGRPATAGANKFTAGGVRCVEDRFKDFICPAEFVETEGSGPGSGGIAGAWA